MATRLLFLWTGLVLLCGHCTESFPGKEFVTAFLQNLVVKQPNPNFELRITGYHPATTVTVKANKATFQKTFNVNKGETISVVIPPAAEMIGTGLFDTSVLIQANKDVSVFCYNYKDVSAAATAVYPVQQLGTLYYVVTPPGTSNGFHEFAVIAYQFPTKVNICLKGAVVFKGQAYPAGSKLVVDLNAFQVIQLQSSVDLSGTKVESDTPVAVLSGHSCAFKRTFCDHAIEQLLPVSSWGTTFIVPPMSFQAQLDTVYVVASQNTVVKHRSGSIEGSRQIMAEQVIQYDLQPSQPLYLSANAGIQVVYFFTGSTSKNYDPFLINIPALTSYCASYHVDLMNSFNNFAIIVAKSSTLSGLVLEEPDAIQWKKVPGTEYSFGQLSLGQEARSALSIQHSTSSFGLFVVGGLEYNGYGSVASCISKDPVETCSSIQCSKWEKCEMQDGHPVCLPDFDSTCWAQGDPHYHTFDGKTFDFMGTCTYTLAKPCQESGSLPFFSVEAKNDNRGNTRVSYVALVKVTVYGFNITVAKNEIGFVRVNNQKFKLPISLNEGKLHLYQSGTSAYIEADYALMVSYDWNSKVVIKISKTFLEHMCGLCGNYNKDPTDDFITPEGTLAVSPIAFATSWKVEDGDRSCWDDCKGECKACPPEMISKYEADETACGLISKGDGPFSLCHSVINPTVYLKNCIYDVCMNDGLKDIMCDALKSYADACQQEGIRLPDWRNLTDCSIICPKNSHFVPCANPCPETCNKEGQPNDCHTRCVEACVCDAGYVLDGGQCIPRDACGCIFEGKPLSPGQQFWGDNTCTKLCTCNPQTKQVTCQAAKCKTEEECRVENGIRDCYPISSQTSYATCSASGDPHYISYDGKRFDFMGTCMYQFSGLCEKRKDLVDFLVLVQNDHRGSQSVSYTRTVEINVYETTIVISREYPGKVLVNGLLANLPYSTKNNQIQMYRSGQAAVMQTDFGLTLTFDWESHITVTVPSTYAGALCGLCGNLNGNKEDELAMKNGTVALNPAAFGQSWEVRKVPGCTGDTSKECPDRSAIEKQQRPLNRECGLILATSGPFRECHRIIDPEGYFQNCVYDYCQFKGQQAVICQAIASYAAACQAAGVTLYPWRTDTFCKLSCGSNSHYELCAKGCDQTCEKIDACPTKCQEGCVCDANFVLSGDRCVSTSQCGCRHEGQYYPAGEIFHPTCQERCICRAGGNVYCASFSCGPNEECRVLGGIRKCYPTGNGTCSAAGDPHYLSFDGLAYDFQGTCKYILAQINTRKRSLTSFTVTVQNEAWGNGKVSVTKMVSVTVYGVTLKLLQNKLGQVDVNGLIQPLPVTISDGRLQVFQHGTNVLIQTEFGLIVSYDLVYHVSVTVPSTFMGQMRGLCGNYNGRKDDEFLLPGGQTTSDVVVFGGAWKVSESESSCSDGCSGGKCPVCDEKKKDVFKQRNYCGIITASDSPFSACHSKVDPSVFFNNCIYDLCLGNGDSQVLCHSIQSYMAACQGAGASVKPWRSPSFCPLKCPANSHYEICTTLCTTSCTQITDSKPCPGTCAEACQCNDGFFFDGLGCVSAEHCGCFQNGRYYKPYEKVLLNRCQKRCHCVPGQGVKCEDHKCADDEACKIQDGVMECVNNDPCKDLQCKQKETCKIENGRAKCVPDFTGICTGFGDPHYQTFDKWKFDFQGTCSYTIAKFCGNDSTLVPFAIDEKNDNRGNQAVSYIRLTNIYVYGYKISIYKQEVGKIRINDIIVNLPITLEDGKIKIYQSGASALLETDFGLQVSYDWNWYLVIVVPSSYYGATCGLCGNFNQNPADEMILPNGTKAPSITSWASSWKIKDRDPFCWDECRGNCPTCDENKKELYGKEEFCGLINKTSDGPFRECHAKLNPDDFFDSCLYDVCINGGAKNILCQALEAYAKTCRKAGAKIYDWRTLSGCVLPCPENSHYEFCGSACPATCGNRTASSTCSQPCVEACQCNNGHVLSVDKCVPVGTCGCTYNGMYYKPGEQFWADVACSSRCTCDSTLGIVTCKADGCKANEKCAMVNGIRTCHPLSTSTCSASGDPHYTTFDGKKYDFMGTCIYQLAGLCSDDASLTPFKVNVENNHRGSKNVSYTKVVTLEVYNVAITLSQEHPRKIKMNDFFVNLPYYLEDKIQAYISGNEGFIKVDFGLTVIFDWNSYVRVIVPSTYTNAVCGLCGNNNQNPKDDLIMKNGNQASSISQFAESWKVAEVEGCTEGCTNNCPVCGEAQKKIYEGDQYCGILIKKDGPFKECHDAVDPTSYFENCVFDTCQYHGQHDTLCNAISVYVATCQALEIQIDPWRRDNFCSLTCPRNSQYELCGNGCPATCHSLSAPDWCEMSCKEGCYCSAGFVLSGDQCVAIGDCGCVHQGKYYKKGEEFYPGTACQQKCICLENGATDCQPFTCGPHEKCKVENGVPGCHPAGYGTCSVSTGSNYLTFDGRAFRFQGSCTYTLAALAGSDPRLVNFSVLVENEKTQTKKIVVSLHGYTVHIARAWNWEIKVNGELYTLPMSTRDGKLRANKEGNNIVIRSISGIKVIYDSSSYVLVFLPSTYKGHVHGLCGNFNGDKADDFTLPDGQQTQKVDEFGASWKVPTKSTSCSNGCGESCPTCDENQISPYRPESSCGMILSKSGPFKDCHALVDPTEFFKQCLYEMCASKGEKDVLCQSIQAYLTACQAAGGTIRPWRTKDFCPLSCPSNSHYELCTKTCDFTCASLSTPGLCSQNCFEGCECNDGYLYDGGRCVPMENCGCLYDGRYIKAGEIIVSEDCVKNCTCHPSSRLSCEETSCQAEEICALRDGVRGCIVQDGECSLTPGAKLDSFDGASGNILNEGVYEVVSLCNKMDPLWFRIIVVVQNCNDFDLPAVATIHVFFKRMFITVKKDKETWVNGQHLQLPTRISEEVSITFLDDKIEIVLNADVKIHFKACGEVKVIVSGDMRGKLCASCGNFNGNKADDLKLPNGKEAGNIAEVVEAWKAIDFSGCVA